MIENPSTKVVRVALGALLRNVEDRLGIPEGYILKIFDEESDWEFVTKLSVVIEAASTDALVSVLSNDNVRDHISRIGQENRLKLCQQLGVLSEQEEGILRQVSLVRNNFAHRVANITKTLDEFLMGLEDGQAKGFHRAFPELDFLDPGDQKFRYRMFVKITPPLHTLAFKGRDADKRRAEQELAELMFRQPMLSSKHTRTVKNG